MKKKEKSLAHHLQTAWEPYRGCNLGANTNVDLKFNIKGNSPLVTTLTAWRMALLCLRDNISKAVKACSATSIH